MNNDLLSAYELELNTLREEGVAFAAQHPAVARMLGLDARQCEDPSVERLLEGVAYLTAKARLHLASDRPAFVEQLLDAMDPSLLGPLPSAAVVQFTTDRNASGLEQCPEVSNGTQLKWTLARPPGYDRPVECRFSVAGAAQLTPLQDPHITVLDSPTDVAAVTGGSPARCASRALRIDLETSGFEWRDVRWPSELSFYVDDNSSAQVLIHALARPSEHPTYWIPETGVPAEVQRPLIGRQHGARLFEPGRRLAGDESVRSLAALPQMWSFLQFLGLGGHLRHSEGERGCLVVPITERKDLPSAQLVSQRLLSNCAPVINLFPLTSGHLRVDPHRNLTPVVLDTFNNHAHEVFAVKSVTALSNALERTNCLLPGDAAQYSQTTKPVAVIERSYRESSNVAGYTPSGLGVALTSLPATTQAAKLEIDCLATNGAWPTMLGSDTSDKSFDTGQGIAGVSRVHCVAGPSQPVSSEASYRDPWNLVRHLSLNFDVLSGTAATLQDHLEGLLHACSQGKFSALPLVIVSIEASTQQLVHRGRVVYIDGLCVSVKRDPRSASTLPWLSAYLAVAEYLGAMAPVGRFVAAQLLDDRDEVIHQSPPRSGEAEVRL